MTIFLAVNALMYLVFAVWCALLPGPTASAVGLSFSHGKGLAEYVAVYGGWQFGLAVFYALSLRRPELRDAALLLSVCLYPALALFRSGAMIFYQSPTSDKGWIFFGLELLFSVWAIFLRLQR